MRAQIEIPADMCALVLEHLSQDFEGCTLKRMPTPIPGPRDALVRIRAVSIGFPDLLMSRGEYQHKPTLPFVPGSDIAGEVVAAGAQLRDFRVGDAVVATRNGGGFAEYGIYAATELRPKPVTLDFEAASAYGAAYLTAHVALVRRANVQPGEWVLVHGAGGGVGLAAVDLAKVLGARVIAASGSDEKLSIIAREYAPDALISTRNGFRARVKEITGGRGADVIFDPVGGDVFDESVHCIAFDGRLLVVGFASGRIPTVAVNMPLIKGFSVVGVRAGEYGRKFPERGHANLEAIWNLAATGQTRPRVHAALPLDRWREAFALMQNRELIGRVVIRPDAH